MIQEGGKRKSSKKVSRKASRKSSRRSSVKSKASRKASRKASKKVSRKSSKKASRRSSVKSKGSKKASKKASKKGSKKARREANPQITVRGALVKYVWGHLDVKKVAAEKNMKPIGIPAKIVQMVMVEAQKEHPVSEANKKSASEWAAVQKIAMKLLEGGMQKYVNQIKKA
jgi:hypothetical protein